MDQHRLRVHIVIICKGVATEKPDVSIQGRSFWLELGGLDPGRRGGRLGHLVGGNGLAGRGAFTFTGRGAFTGRWIGPNRRSNPAILLELPRFSGSSKPAGSGMAGCRAARIPVHGSSRPRSRFVAERRGHTTVFHTTCPPRPPAPGPAGRRGCVAGVVRSS